MTVRVPANSLGGTGDPYAAEAQEWIEDLVNMAKECFGGQQANSATLSGDQLTLVNSAGMYELTSQTGSTDDLKFIAATFGTIGFDDMIVAIFAASGHTITVKHNITGNGKIMTLNGLDATLSGRNGMLLRGRYVDGSVNQFDEFFRGDVTSLVGKVPGAAQISTLTIGSSSEAIIPTSGIHAVDTNGGGPTDDLKFIDATNDVTFLFLTGADDTHVVTVKHNVTGDGKIQLVGAIDITLSTTKGLVLYRTGSAGSYIWKELGRFGYSSGITVSSKTGNFSSSPDNHYQCNTSGGPITATQAASGGYEGKDTTFKLIDATEPLKVVFSGGQSCDGETELWVRDLNAVLVLRAISGGYTKII